MKSINAAMSSRAADNYFSESSHEPLDLRPEDYTVGWICAVYRELIAARAMLDRTHAKLKARPKYDENSYTLGSIGDHHVAIACLPGYGTSNAAIVAKSMQSTFPNLRFGLMVGIGGGIPSVEHDRDIRFGDLVICLPSEKGGGVIQYDLGKKEIGDHGFRRLGSLNKPPTLLRNVVVELRATRNLGKMLSDIVNKTFKNYDEDTDEEWTYPTTAKDTLFKASFPHVNDKKSNCDVCLEKENEGSTVFREPRKSLNPRIHYGNIASGNSVMKDAAERDFIADRDDVICFEMEAAGLMDDFPCLVIRGICDYADSHKSKRWQPYAAAVAAAYAKKLLLEVPPEAVEKLEPIRSSPLGIGGGSITFAGSSTARTIINHYDFSMGKISAPHEFYALGQTLTAGRREMAEDGTLHITARRLGAIFESILPQMPTLIKCYGIRAGEIATASTEYFSTGLGIFSGAAGIDGASLWAGATSGEGAIQVHLLACLLASMWNGPEATSIWFELLKCRREELRNEFHRCNSLPIGTMIAAQYEIDRSQLAEWDASARAWLQTADNAKLVPQKRIIHEIGGLDKFVNSKPFLYESVINAWMAGLKGMEALLQGSPMHMQSGDMLPALCSWHLYPDLNIVDPGTKIVSQGDPLVPASGILTIGLQNRENAQGKGLQWSLPLAHLRFYGDPIRRTSTISPQGSHLTLEEFNMTVLGCVLGGWNIEDRGIEDTLKWISKLSIPLLDLPGMKRTIIEESWLQILADSAHLYLISQNLDRERFRQLLNSGRKYYSFLGRPSLPFFGLSDINRAVYLANDVEAKIKLLRSQATLTKMPWKHAIIRYVSERTGLEEYASASIRGRSVLKRTQTDGTKASGGHIRWVFLLPIQKPRNALEAKPIRRDFVFGSEKPLDPEPESSTKGNDSNTKGKEMHSLVPDREMKFAFQKKRYENLGEEVIAAEKEPLKTLAPVGKPMRVIWGHLEMSPHSMEDGYEHWWGEVKHYEYWLGDPASAAIFIRIDQEKPESRTLVPFSELHSLFRQGFFNANLMPVLIDSLQQFESSYVESLRAISTMNLLYKKLKQATINVRVFERPLANAKWLRALFGAYSTDEGPANSLRDDEVEHDTHHTEAGPEDYDIGTIEDQPPSQLFEDAMYALPTHESSSKSFAPRFLSKQEAIKMASEHAKATNMDIKESFSCILYFENCFDISPSQLRSVMAMSSGNSLFIAAPLLLDPTRSPGRVKIRHVMRNVGRAGIALLIPPVAPRLISCGIERWPQIKLAPWDGHLRDSFRDSSLHLWFTGSSQEVDIGYSGAQDKELYYLESVVSLHGMGEWVADLDVLGILQGSPFIYRHNQDKTVSQVRINELGMNSVTLTCGHGHDLSKYCYDELPLAAVENWFDLMEDTQKSRIFLASENWQARLAALMICIAKKRQVCLISGPICWTCLISATKSLAQLKAPTIYV